MRHVCFWVGEGGGSAHNSGGKSFVLLALQRIKVVGAWLLEEEMLLGFEGVCMEVWVFTQRSTRIAKTSGEEFAGNDYMICHRGEDFFWFWVK